MERDDNTVRRNEVVGILNIDDRGTVGGPDLEIFSANGMAARVSLGKAQSLAYRHFPLSDPLDGKQIEGGLTLRLVDECTTLSMSIVPMDYLRRDIALDDGSDRFSTFSQFDCDPKRS